jgi:hypothetical protein
MTKPGVEEKAKKEAHSKIGLVLKDVPPTGSDGSPTEQEKLKRDYDLFNYHQKKAEKIANLKKLFALVFKKEEWECSNHGKHLQYKNIQNPRQIVHVEKKKGEVKFYGDPIEKVIEAARKYEEDCGREMKYEVECDTLDGAISFMTELHQKGFDISKIENIVAKDAKEYKMKDIIADIYKKFPKPSTAPKLTASQTKKDG